MNNAMKTSTKIILEELIKVFPDQTAFRKSQVMDTGKKFGYTGKDWDPLFTADNRVKIGTYDFANQMEPLRNVVSNIPQETPAGVMKMQSIVNEESH